VHGCHSASIPLLLGKNYIKSMALSCWPHRQGCLHRTTSLQFLLLLALLTLTGPVTSLQNAKWLPRTARDHRHPPTREELSPTPQPPPSPPLPPPPPPWVTECDKVLLPVSGNSFSVSPLFHLSGAPTPAPPPTGPLVFARQLAAFIISTPTQFKNLGRLLAVCREAAAATLLCR
jgi:hypothetical protein